MEETVGRLAAGAHGVVTTRQMLGAGVTEDEIRHRAQMGALIRVHRGVYRVGHLAPSCEATYMAAVLACGEEALLAGRAAAYLLGIIGGSPPTPQVVTRAHVRVAGVATGRGARHRRSTRWRGIPVVSPAEALVDLAADLSLDDLAQAAHRAGILHRTTPRQVAAALARRPKSKGAAKLQMVIGRRAQVTLSQLERRFLRVLREQRLPPPDEVNRLIDQHRIDCRWRQQRLTVELDSFRFHNSRHSWQRDRERERAAYARGDQHRRYTYADVFEDPTAMLREIDGLLRANIAA